MVLSIIFGDESNQNKKIGGCIFSELCFLQKNSVTFALQPSQDHFFLHTCMVKNIQSQPGGVGHGLIPAGRQICVSLRTAKAIKTNKQNQKTVLKIQT